MSGQYSSYSVLSPGGGGGGTVTAVTASGVLSSSGGATPNITFTGTLPIANGGTGQVTSNAALNALLPSQATNSGKFLTTDGTNSSWASVSASPAGANTDVQFNDSGVFGGTSDFTFDKTKKSVTIGAASQTVGNNSISIGSNGADGAGSLAGGTAGSRASGNNSMAWGFGAMAQAGQSFAFGDGATASNTDAFAWGESTHASGTHSFAGSINSVASGPFSMAIGVGPTASGTLSTALGDTTLSSGYGSLAMGQGTNAQAFGQLVIGSYNIPQGTAGSVVATDDGFQIGVGAGSGTPITGFAVTKQGKIKLYDTTTAPFTRFVGFKAPTALAATTDYILPPNTGTSGQVLSTNGSGTLTWAGTVTSVTASGVLSSSGGTTPDITFTGVLPIANGGTGQTTANTALNALLPSQTSNSGKFLTTDGTNSSWATAGGGGISSPGIAQVETPSSSFLNSPMFSFGVDATDPYGAVFFGSLDQSTVGTSSSVVNLVAGDVLATSGGGVPGGVQIYGGGSANPGQAGGAITIQGGNGIDPSNSGGSIALIGGNAGGGGGSNNGSLTANTLRNINMTADNNVDIEAGNELDLGATGDMFIFAGTFIDLSAPQVILDTAHLTTQGSSPTTTINSNAGTGASSSVANATDVAGQLTLTTGSGSFAAGEQTKINFHTPYLIAPKVLITAVNAAGAVPKSSQGFYITSTTTDFSLNFAIAETGADTYIWNYHVIETQ